MVAEKLILEKLEKIEKEVGEIRNNMINKDSILTEDDYKALLAYRKEKKGKLASHEQVKSGLGL